MKKYNISSIFLLILLLIFGFKYRFKDNIKWKKNTITWENFKDINSIEGGYDANILSKIKINKSCNNKNFEIYAYMNPNYSNKVKDSILGKQLLIHETYHFNVTEYHARLFRKEVISIGRDKLTTRKLKLLLKKYNKRINEMQDKYDTESDHNVKTQKQRYWELKIDDLLRQTALYEDTYLNNYQLFNPEKNNYFKRINISFNNKILKSYPLKKAHTNNGEYYELIKNKDTTIIKFFKDGKNIRGGTFDTAILKLIQLPNNKTEKHYLNKDNTFNKNIKHQIETYSVNQKGEITLVFYDSEKKIIKEKSIWKKSNNNVFEGFFYKSNGEPSFNSDGLFKIIKKTDYLNRVTEIKYLDKENLPKLNDKSLFASAKYSYDKNHNIIKKQLFNSYGGYAKHIDKYNVSYKYDSFGNLIELTSHNENNEKQEDKTGISIYTYNYDVFGNITQIKRYNHKRKPVLGSKNIFKSVEDYNSKNKLIFQAYYYFNNTLKFNDDDKWGATKYKYIGDSIKLRYNVDAFNNHFNDDTNIATIKQYLNKKGSPIKTQYLDIENNFAKTEDNVSQYINKYDSNNNKIEEINLDSLGNKIAFTKDVATIKWEYNKRNIKVKTSYFDKNDKLAYAKQGATFNIYKIDDKDRIFEHQFYNNKMKPIEVDGIHKSIYTYNRFNKDSIINNYNKFNKLINGVSTTKYKYNKYGTLIEESYYNSKGKITLDSNMISIKEYLINDRQQSTGYKYFKKNHEKANIKSGGYHHEKIELNNYGYTNSISYYNKKGNPTLNSEGYHKVVSEKDNRGEEIKYATFDAQLKPKENSIGIAESIYNRADTGIINFIEYKDKNGKLTNNENGVSQIFYEPYINGLFYLEKQLDKNGNEVK